MFTKSYTHFYINTIISITITGLVLRPSIRMEAQSRSQSLAIPFTINERSLVWLNSIESGTKTPSSERESRGGATDRLERMGDYRYVFRKGYCCVR